MWRHGLCLLLLLSLPAQGAAQSCDLSFTVEVTQGVGTILPGTRLEGQASFTATGRSFRQEGGSTTHLAEGEMRLGSTIRGEIWTLITTSRGPTADLVGIHARDVQGLSFGGLAYNGPMMVTLFGRPGARPDTAIPVRQADWDRMDLRRAFSLHAHGVDMLAGVVSDLVARCN